ncbi:hypothetical protein JX265_013049 [Neoarthrinium moseri]|uniref:aldehyde dehydrogenase (NAD(+)) n=1 Tax=Neoarthrinium moseri TaxID=1658444 RepID=A0A9P9W929_9PEZI|nr:hypothetical protein JX265_013049 [Neoarthrinium moseri]
MSATLTIGSSHPKELDFENFYNVINGELTKTKEIRNGTNPSTLEKNPDVPVSTVEDVNRAVDAARAAAHAWALTPWTERQKAILSFADALSESKLAFARMQTIEQGKPLALAMDEIDKAVQWLTVQAKMTLPNEVVEETDEKRVVTRYTPLGVALAIVPWNSCGKIAPALVTGNTLILKPSPYTPYCGLKLAELAQRFFPPGVFQALSGGDDLGPMLTEHPGIDKVSFTGSTATGKRVMKSCSNTLKRVTLELLVYLIHGVGSVLTETSGGNDPAIVCADVDVTETAQKIALFSLLNSGQICVAIKRIYVHSSIFAEFTQALVQMTQAFRVGDGLGDVELGPVQNSMQYERVKDLLAKIEAQNLKIATELKASDASDSTKKGYFITPTVIENPPDDSCIVVEEPFGPVFPVLKWDTEEEVLRRANDTDMGLGASVWTKDLEKAESLASRLNAGSVWVNTHLELQPNAPFGGHKQSGIGCEWGLQGLRSYCNTQTLFLKKK